MVKSPLVQVACGFFVGVELENVSRRGKFFITDLQSWDGPMLDLLLEMPEAITGMPAADWICLGHLVRVEPGAALSRTSGIGVEIDFYVVSHAATARWELAPGMRGPVSP